MDPGKGLQQQAGVFFNGRLGLQIERYLFPKFLWGCTLCQLDHGLKGTAPPTVNRKIPFAAIQLPAVDKGNEKLSIVKNGIAGYRLQYSGDSEFILMIGNDNLA